MQEACALQGHFQPAVPRAAVLPLLQAPEAWQAAVQADAAAEPDAAMWCVATIVL
jgi:hypothetical protein